MTWMPCEARRLRPIALRRWRSRMICWHWRLKARTRSCSGGHPHDAEGLLVASREAVHPLAEGQRVEPVVLDALALLVPVLGLHHVVGTAHFREATVQVVAERSRLVAGKTSQARRRCLATKCSRPSKVIFSTGWGVAPSTCRAT